MSTVDTLIRQAIAERRLLAFTYRGAERVCEPHDYGIRNGTAQLLSYQVSGASRSGPRA